MNIDSPYTQRQKILESYSPNHQYKNSNKKDVSYFARNGFGSQRLKLVQFVQNQLNEKHKNDAEILQKFRKQAQQYKKSLRRKKSNNNSQIVLTPPEIKHIPTQKSQQVQEFIKPQKIVLRQVGIQTDINQRKLLKQLGKKQQQLKKRDRVIKKNIQKIKQLNHKLRKVEHENMKRDLQQSRKFENQSIVKIKQLVQSLSDRLQDNYQLLNEKKKKRRLRNSQKIKVPIIEDEETPKKSLKSSQKILKHDWQERPIVNYSVKIQSQTKKEKNNLATYLKTLEHNRQRLQKLNQQN